MGKTLLRLFHHALQLSGGRHSFEIARDEAAHIRSLRLKEGDLLEICNGKGVVAQAKVSQLAQRTNESTFVQLVEPPKVVSRPPFSITLAVAFPKSPERSDFIVEKCTEIGVDEIIPIVGVHSVAREESYIHRVPRWERVSISAAKQSHQAYFPRIHNPRSLHEFIEYMKHSWQFSQANHLTLIGDPHSKKGIHNLMRNWMKTVPKEPSYASIGFEPMNIGNRSSSIHLDVATHDEEDYLQPRHYRKPKAPKRSKQQHEENDFIQQSTNNDQPNDVIHKDKGSTFELMRPSEQHNVCIVIGPEGGFSEEEVQTITEELEAHPVLLNQHVLRVETAAMATASVVASYIVRKTKK